MTTSLNDAVCEVYSELMAYSDEQVYRSRKLKRLMHNPSLFFVWLGRKYRKLYGRAVFGKRSNLTGSTQHINEFTPTSKIYPEAKIAVYTVITGGYDNLKSPVYADDSIDYYAVTDSESLSVNMRNGGGLNFRVLRVPEHLSGLNSVRQQRYIKLHPDEVLSEEATGRKYDYTVYIDGSLRITCDIKPLVYSLIESGKSIAIHEHFIRDCIYDEAFACYLANKADIRLIRKQMDFYRSEGMPEHFGLPETPTIIRKCNDSYLQKVMHEWWLQIDRFTHRDQLSLPYVLWKNGLDMSYIFSLGNNVWRNPYFLAYRHN